jgi:glutaconate CoA-transferase subunit A
MGIPFIPVRGAIDSDYMRIREDFLVVEDPYHPGERTVIVPAMAPDVALLHGLRGDRYGNLILPAHQDARLAALASRTTVVTVEEVVDGPVTPGVGETVLSGIHVGAVVHAPGASHPYACPPHYAEDRAHLQEYVDAASGTPDDFEAYLRRYVFEPRGLSEYLERVGWQSPVPRV